MINISKGPGGEALHLTALVAFDRTSGQVYGTFVHASLQEDDDVGVSRSRELFLADLASHPGRERAQIEALQVSLQELPAGSIDRVDPRTRKLTTSASTRQLSGITRV